MRGRKPDPPNLKLLKGRKGAAPASPPTAAPACPFDLDRVATAEWERIAPVLHLAGRLSEVDAPILALYCQTYSIRAHAMGDIALNGVVLLADSGAVKANPAAAVARDAAATMIKILGSFGCTPADRARLGLAETVLGSDPLDAFLSRPRKKSQA